MTTQRSESPSLRLLRVEEVTRRHQLNLSKMSPWQRSDSDPNLFPTPSSFITGSRYSRRPLLPQNQFRSTLKSSGDLEFRPMYREMFVSYPPDACVFPRVTRRRQRRRHATVEGGVGAASLHGTEDDEERTTPRQLKKEHHSSASRESALVSQNIETEFRALNKGGVPNCICLQLEGEQYFNSEYRESFIDSPRHRPTKPPRPQSSIKSEGDFNFETEFFSNFLPYNLSTFKRPELKRYQTELTLLKGHMSFCPEYRASFVSFPRQRSSPIRHPTNLVLEKGSMEVMTEQKDQFNLQNGQVSPRPSIIRRPTTLRLNGCDEISLDASSATSPAEISPEPEYRDVYKDFPRSRPAFPKPVGSLTPEGPWLGKSPEYRSEYVDFPRQRPTTKKQGATLQPFGGVSDKCHEYRESYKDFPRKRPQVNKPVQNLKPEGEMMGSDPEYKDSYRDHPRQRPILKKTPENLKMEGKMRVKPEYTEQYKDFPRKRPDSKKPFVTLKTEGEFTDKYAEYKENFKDSPRSRPKVTKTPDNLKPEGEIMEKEAEYKESYKKFPCKRPEIKKIPDSIKIDKNPMDQSPEYKEAYQVFPRERPTVPKPVENLKMEGDIMLEHAEYRESYVDFPRQRPDVPRPSQNLKIDGPWHGRFPEYRAAFIDLPRHRPIVLKPSNTLADPDALGGGYTPKSPGIPRPKSAGAQRSRSPAGIPTGAPTHTKRSSRHAAKKKPSTPPPQYSSASPVVRPLSRGRFLGRPGHLPEARPLSRTNPTAAALVAEQSKEEFTAFQVIDNSPMIPECRQVKFDLTKPLTPRSSTKSAMSSSREPSASSAISLIDASVPQHSAANSKCRGEGKWGTGWLTINPDVKKL